MVSCLSVKRESSNASVTSISPEFDIMSLPRLYAGRYPYPQTGKEIADPTTSLVAFAAPDVGFHQDKATRPGSTTLSAPVKTFLPTLLLFCTISAALAVDARPTFEATSVPAADAVDCEALRAAVNSSASLAPFLNLSSCCPIRRNSFLAASTLLYGVFMDLTSLSVFSAATFAASKSLTFVVSVVAS